MPRVSIIIPVYNPGDFLRAAITSVQQQTFADWELVLVDDGSREDLSWIRQEFPWAHLHRQENSGASVARNNGILRARGEFIAFMDQDDLWLPEKLTRQVEALSADEGAGMCYCDLEVIDRHGHVSTPSVASTACAPVVELDPQETQGSENRGALHRSVLYFSQRFVVPSTVMIRRQSLAVSGLLDPFIPFSGDYDLIIKLGSKYRVVRIPNADVRYRKHDNNFSDQYEVGRAETRALIARYENYAQAKGDVRLAKDVSRLFRRPGRIFSAQAIDRARRSFRERNYSAAFRHVVRAMRFHPFFVIGSFRTWLAVNYRKRFAADRR